MNMGLYLLEQLMNGICQGSIYAMIAIGYTLIFGVTGLVTFCYGEIVMMGGFAAYYVFNWFGVVFPLALLGAFLFSAFVGFWVHKICYERFLSAPRHVSLLCTIGMSMLLRNLAQIFFSLDMKSMPTILAGKYFRLFGKLRITYLQILIMSIVVLLSVLLTLFLNKTRIGAALRCVKQDKKAAALLGVDASRMTLLGNCLGSGLGGIAGVLYCITYMSVSATMGSTIGRIGYSSAVLGGMTNIPVSAFGAVIIGILENLSIVFVSASLRNGVAFLFLIIVLIFLPQGIGSKKKGELKL